MSGHVATTIVVAQTMAPINGRKIQIDDPIRVTIKRTARTPRVMSRCVSAMSKVSELVSVSYSALLDLNCAFDSARRQRSAAGNRFEQIDHFWVSGHVADFFGQLLSGHGFDFVTDDSLVLAVKLGVLEHLAHRLFKHLDPLFRCPRHRDIRRADEPEGPPGCYKLDLARRFGKAFDLG